MDITLIKNSLRSRPENLLYVGDKSPLLKINIPDNEKKTATKMIKESLLYGGYGDYSGDIIKSINNDDLFSLSNILYDMNKKGFIGTLVPFENYSFYQMLHDILLRNHELRVVFDTGLDIENLILFNYY